MGGGGRSTRQWMLWSFKLQGCKDCGRSYPEIALEDLHCDHRDPTQKRVTGTRSLTKTSDGLLGHNSHSQLLNELVKCDVVCVDCHKERHAKRRWASIHEQQALFSGTGEAWRSTA